MAQHLTRIELVSAVPYPKPSYPGILRVRRFYPNRMVAGSYRLERLVQRSSPWSPLLLREATQAAIALLVVASIMFTMVFSVLSGKSLQMLPSWAPVTLATIVGYYFGLSVRATEPYPPDSPGDPQKL